MTTFRPPARPDGLIFDEPQPNPFRGDDAPAEAGPGWTDSAFSGRAIALALSGQIWNGTTIVMSTLDIIDQLRALGH